MKIKKYLKAIGILILLWMAFRYSIKVIVISSALSSKDAATEATQLTDDYKIYNSLINNHLTNTKTELILVQNQTGLGFRGMGVSEALPFIEIEKDLWVKFKTKNTDSFTLSTSFILEHPYMLVESHKVENLNRTLLIFDNINSTPFLQFSRVGYNSRNDEALVHVSMFFWGDEFLNISTFAFGEYILLKKVNGIWLILKEWQSFIT